MQPKNTASDHCMHEVTLHPRYNTSLLLLPANLLNNTTNQATPYPIFPPLSRGLHLNRISVTGSHP